MIKVGYAEVNITPQEPLELVGFNREDNMSKGVRKPLLAQVTVWESDDYCCLITIDSIGFMKEMTDVLRIKVSNALHVSCDKVMVCFSHCHSAPNADRSKKYFEMVCENVLDALRQALHNIKPVLVGWDNAEVEIGVNRRVGNTNLDKRAGVLKVYGAKDKQNKLLLVRVTAHCNVLKGDNYLISPDYFGAIREVLQEKYHCPIMVIQGSAGNIAPKYFDSVETPIDARGPQYMRSKEALENMADEVYQKLSKKIDTIKLMDAVPVRMYSKATTLQAKIPSAEEAEKIAWEAKEYCGIDGAAWLEEVSRLREKGVQRQEERVEVQYFSIGDWCMCGVPYELMVEFALAGVEKTGNEHFYINGYTNGCLSYFPTEDEYDKGGYEVYWSMLIYYIYFHRVFPFERDSAERLLEFMIINK